MSARAVALATMTSCGAALLVSLLYAPALQAPFLVPKFAALEVAAALGWVAFAWRHMSPGGPRWTRTLTAGALLVLGSTALAWLAAWLRGAGTPYAIDATARWVALFGIACGACALSDDTVARQRLLESVTVAAAAVASIGLLQHLEMLPLHIPVISTPGSTFGNRNLAAEVMAMALPLGLGAVLGAPRRDTRWVMATSLALELVYLAVTRTRGAWLGAACGLATALWLSRVRWSLAWVGGAVGVVVAACIAATLPGRYNPRDAGDTKRYSGLVEVLEGGFDARSTALRTRLGFWRRTATMVRDHWVLGVGPGNWPIEFPRYAEPDATKDGVLSATVAPRQAHDDLLERAAETGLPGLVALAVLAAGAAMAVRESRRRIAGADRVTTAAAGGALAGLAGLSMTGFPLEMPGTITFAGLALGLVACGGRSDPSSERARPASSAWLYGAVAAGLLLTGLAAWRADRHVRSSAWLGVAERALRANHEEEGAAAAIEALDRALAIDPVDYRAELRLSQMLLREHKSAASVEAAKRALNLEPNSTNAWAALAAATLQGGDAATARGFATRALDLLHDFPFALQVRARAADSEGDASSAAKDREHLAQLAAGSPDDETTRRARALLPWHY